MKHMGATQGPYGMGLEALLEINRGRAGSHRGGPGPRAFMYGQLGIVEWASAHTGDTRSSICGGFLGISLPSSSEARAKLLVLSKDQPVQGPLPSFPISRPFLHSSDSSSTSCKRDDLCVSVA